MKRSSVLTLAAVCVFAACKRETAEAPPVQPVTADTLASSITSDLTLDASKNYVINGQVFVKNNATLTIPAGVTVSVVKNDEPGNKGVLVITQGAKLVVNGTVDQPVVFTSAAATKAPGDWGGIIIIGKAPTNVVTGNVDGLAVSDDTRYGGTVADDNSGSIKFLRLEYPGGINPDAEEEWGIDKASGFVLQSVGSGTKVDNVMVSHSKDDGFQFVGGTVNVSHLIAYNNGDDDYDFDYGYQGRMQFIISYRSELNSAHALRANAFESYNDAVPTLNAPLTRPIVSNMTIVGPQGVAAAETNLNQGVYIRKGTRFVMQNSIIAEYPKGGLMLCPRTKPVLLNNTGSEFKYNLVNSDDSVSTFAYDNGSDPAGFRGVAGDASIKSFALNEVNKNTLITSSADLKLTSLYSANGPNLTPLAASPAVSGANFEGPNFASFFTPVTYRGAVGENNWAAASAWTDWK